MSYTLAKLWLWLLLALALGVVVGWLLWGRRKTTITTETNVDTDVERLRGRLANLEPVVAERDRLKAELAECRAASRGAASGVAAFAGVGDAPAVVERVAPDVSGAEAVLGKKITLDDLKVVEGVGPKIEELMHGVGITTWWGLADAPVDSLRSMLDAAGPRFQIQEPGTWPQQARLLAEGSWAEFKALTDRLDGGKEVS